MDRRERELGQPDREFQGALRIDPGAWQIVQRLRANGYQALLAGGCVRDWLLGQRPEDWDVVTDAAPEVVMRLFDRTYPIGVQFGIVVVRLAEGEYEVARFRQDGPYQDGRHPQTIAFADARADAWRRDFTINGMFLDPQTGEVIDYVGGREDLKRGIIRAIGDPAQRFAEDYLRMLRAVRFAARFSFEIEEKTLAAIAAHAARIVNVSAERIRDELTLILTEGGAGRGLQFLLDTGLLREILPEVAAMEGVPQPPEFHPEGDLWIHVKLALEALVAPSRSLAWGTLLHDIGKPPTLVKSDRIRFDEHDAIGARLAEEICRRLRMSGDDTRRICELVANHMRLRHIREMRPGKRQRFLREPYFPELLELHRADCLASHAQLDLYEFCRQQLAESAQQERQPARLLTGHDLIARGLTPGPRFREILEALEEEQLEGRVRTRAEAERFVEERFGVPRA